MMAIADALALIVLNGVCWLALGALLMVPALHRAVDERDELRQQRDDARTDAWRWRKLARGRMRGPHREQGGDHAS